MDNKKVITLIHVLVKRQPINADARLTLKIAASTMLAIGPAPGNIPKNTPSPNPSATLCAESSIRKSWR